MLLFFSRERHVSQVLEKQNLKVFYLLDDKSKNELFITPAAAREMITWDSNPTLVVASVTGDVVYSEELQKFDQSVLQHEEFVLKALTGQVPDYRLPITGCGSNQKITGIIRTKIGASR